MKNRKGFTVVELVVSFVLISIIVIGMLSIALTYRGKAQLSTQKLELEKYKATLTKEIQDDLLDYELTNISYCTAGNKNCLLFSFADGSSKRLELANTNVLDRYIRYGGQKFAIDEYFPIPPTSLDEASIILPRTGIDFAGTMIGTNAVYKIDIPISHTDLEGDFGIHIVALQMPNTP